MDQVVIVSVTFCAVAIKNLFPLAFFDVGIHSMNMLGPTTMQSSHNNSRRTEKPGQVRHPSSRYLSCGMRKQRAHPNEIKLGAEVNLGKFFTRVNGIGAKA